MLPKMRQRAKDEKGFTLIELLVVILIIGILAAIAIPSFLNQKGKANDANTKAVVRTAQTAEETLFTDNQAYTGAGASAALVTVEPTLTSANTACDATPPAVNTNGPCSLATAIGNVSSASGAAAGTAANSFDVSAVSKTGVTYHIIRNADGTVQRTCTPASVGGCNAGSTW